MKIIYRLTEIFSIINIIFRRNPDYRVSVESLIKFKKLNNMHSQDTLYIFFDKKLRSLDTILLLPFISFTRDVLTNSSILHHDIPHQFI